MGAAVTSGAAREACWEGGRYIPLHAGRESGGGSRIALTCRSIEEERFTALCYRYMPFDRGGAPSPHPTASQVKTPASVMVVRVTAWGEPRHQDLHFKIKSTMLMHKLMLAYCARRGCSLDTARFVFKGQVTVTCRYMPLHASSSRAR